MAATPERMRFTFTIEASTPAEQAARERQAIQRVAAAMQALVDRLSPDEVEHVSRRIEGALRNAPAAEPGGVDARLAGGKVYRDEERVALELANLRRTFALRREILQGALSAPQVAHLLGTSRQTPHDRVAAGSLLAIRDNGALRFPRWQFDPAGPDAVILGLPAVLRTLRLPPLSQASWLLRPNAELDGATPLALLQRGETQRVQRAAATVGVS